MFCTSPIKNNGSEPSESYHKLNGIILMTAKEEKKKRIEILKALISPDLRDDVPINKDYLIAYLMVDHGVSKRSAREEIEAVIIYLKENPRLWQQTTPEDVLKNIG